MSELEASEQERRQLAYSTQFFDFTPDAFVDGVSGACYEAINEHLDVSIPLFSFRIQVMEVNHRCQRLRIRRYRLLLLPSCF